MNRREILKAAIAPAAAPLLPLLPVAPAVLPRVYSSETLPGTPAQLPKSCGGSFTVTGGAGRIAPWAPGEWEAAQANWARMKAECDLLDAAEDAARVRVETCVSVPLI